MPARREAALVALALAACDSSIKLQVVSTIVSPRPEGGSASSAGSAALAGAGGSAGSATAGAGGTGELAGDGGTDSGSGGEPSPAWDAPPLYVASFASQSNPGEYMRERDKEGFVSVIDPLTEADAANFEVIPGLLDADCISFRQPGGDGSFLRHSNSRIYFTLAHDEPLFRGDATFCPEPGLGEKTWTSFRSYNFPKQFLMVKNGDELWIGPDDGSEEFAAAATFRIENPFLPPSGD